MLESGVRGRREQGWRFGNGGVGKEVESIE